MSKSSKAETKQQREMIIFEKFALAANLQIESAVGNTSDSKPDLFLQVKWGLLLF